MRRTIRYADTENTYSTSGKILAYAAVIRMAAILYEARSRIATTLFKEELNLLTARAEALLEMQGYVVTMGVMSTEVPAHYLYSRDIEGMCDFYLNRRNIGVDYEPLDAIRARKEWL